MKSSDMKNIINLLLIIGSVTLMCVSCKKESTEPCDEPNSQQLLIVLKDSTGNYFIDRYYPNLSYLIVSDSLTSFYVGTRLISPDQNPRTALDVNIDKMISGYPYLLEFDSLTIDTVAVYWSVVNTSCDNNQFYHREVDSVIYNDTTFYGGYMRTIIR